MSDRIPEALLQEASQQLTSIGLSSRAQISDDADSDGSLRVETPGGVVDYKTVIKTNITKNTAGALTGSELKILVADYISDATAEVLRGAHVQYIDSAGNMHLRAPGLWVEIRGRRRPHPVSDSTSQRLRTFRASGVRVIFVLLCHPKVASAPFRDISAMSDASLGTVQQVFKELENLGFIYRTGNDRRLQRLDRLFDRWVEAYILNLWPKLTLANFLTADYNWWKTADPGLRSEGAQWGGETAAHKLEGRLLPERSIIYSNSLPTSLIITNRLRKASQDSNIEFRRRFWHFDDAAITVPTPLVYADLIASTDSRQREAAEHLRTHDRHLRRLSDS
jgi:hypothetical protein